METIFYAGAGTLLFVGFTFLFLRFINSYNRWKYTTKEIKSGWRVDRVPSSNRKTKLKVSNYQEGYPTMREENGFRVHINSHLL